MYRTMGQSGLLGTRVGRIWKFVRTPKICRARSLIISCPRCNNGPRRHGGEYRTKFIAFY